MIGWSWPFAHRCVPPAASTSAGRREYLLVGGHGGRSFELHDAPLAADGLAAVEDFVQ